MPTRSRSFFVRSVGVRLGLRVHRVARAWARLERRVRDYVLKTTPRRRASRVVGIGMFGFMTLCLMGANS